MIGATVCMTLAVIGAGLWIRLKLQEKKLLAALQKIQQELGSISIHTSDQTLAKKGYFGLQHQKAELSTKIARCRNNQRNVLIFTALFGFAGSVLLFCNA